MWNFTSYCEVDFEENVTDISGCLMLVKYCLVLMVVLIIMVVFCVLF